MSADPFLKLFIGLLLYLILLVIIRWLHIGKKKTCENCNNCCPDCMSGLNRIQRFHSDKLIFHLTFRIFDLKRYLCNHCGWEGLRWENKYRPGE